uniref:Glutamate-rich WD repeat-containing protein 1 n=1 Tax=Setaria digitata TaxID=48799 RepID=A0A915Q6D9_9BILA
MNSAGRALLLFESKKCEKRLDIFKKTEFLCGRHEIAVSRKRKKRGNLGKMLSKTGNRKAKKLPHVKPPTRELRLNFGSKTETINEEQYIKDITFQEKYLTSTSPWDEHFHGVQSWECVKMEDLEEQRDVEMMEDDVKESEKIRNAEKKVYIPGVSRPLRKDEEWDFDPEAYRLYHSFETRWPCLSFDTIADDLGDDRTDFPMSCYLVGGTQAEKATNNELIVMNLSNLNPIRGDEVSDSDDDVDENPRDREPKLHAATIPHIGIVNRVKTTTLGQSKVCAAFSSQGKVTLWNLTQAMEDISSMEGRDRIVKRPKERPFFSFVGHQAEGYALSWSPLQMGKIASGDIRHKIHLWTMAEGGQWVVDPQPLTEHKESVEDLCWSPTEEALLASCSADHSIKLWDTRLAPSDACVCTVANAHESHANVISWNKFEPLIMSGGDDAALNVWSLKTMQFKEPVARFKQHKAPITSVEWSPHETTTVMASGEDNQVTIWDLALEADSAEEIAEVPPQLLFVHMGQKEVKEVHWHNQIPGFAVTTALSGFNLFKPINL